MNDEVNRNTVFICVYDGRDICTSESLPKLLGGFYIDETDYKALVQGRKVGVPVVGGSIIKTFTIWSKLYNENGPEPYYLFFTYEIRLFKLYLKAQGFKHGS